MGRGAILTGKVKSRSQVICVFGYTKWFITHPRFIKWRSSAIREQAQMTVEFVVIFPIALIVGLIAMNALLFFSECAAFDNHMRQEVCRIAAVPAYEQSLEQSVAQIQTELNNSFSEDYLRIEKVSVQQSNGAQQFSAVLCFSPTLFGRSLSSSVFGVELFELNHRCSCSVSVYKPGVLL